MNEQGMFKAITVKSNSKNKKLKVSRPRLKKGDQIQWYSIEEGPLALGPL